jgi:hypothetical protein
LRKTLAQKISGETAAFVYARDSRTARAVLAVDVHMVVLSYARRGLQAVDRTFVSRAVFGIFTIKEDDHAQNCSGISFKCV